MARHAGASSGGSGVISAMSCVALCCERRQCHNAPSGMRLQKNSSSDATGVGAWGAWLLWS